VSKIIVFPGVAKNTLQTHSGRNSVIYL